MPDPISAPKPDSESQKGLLSAIAALVIWGLFPVYFVAMAAVPAVEMVAQRVLWSMPFGLIILLILRQWGTLMAIFRQPRTLFYLSIAAILLGINWGVYIYAVQIGQIFQGSLGYYINPLLNVLVGFLIFRERFSALQVVAVAFATIGVMILGLYGGVFPWLSIILGTTFCAYAAMRKVVEVPAMAGLMVEVLVLLLPTLAYLGWLASEGQLSFGQDLTMSLLLIAAGPLTLIPLLLYVFAARRIRFSTLGIIQFIGPTLQFACALYYGEQFTSAHAWCFGFIWLGVALFAFDAAAQNRRPIRTPSA